MKIGFIGAGGIGSYYAAIFAQCGYDVTLLARGDHAAAIREHGLQVKSRDHGEFTIDNLRVVSSTEEMRGLDVVFICVKTYSIEEIGPMLHHCDHDNVTFIPIQNGIYNDKVVERWIDPSHIANGNSYIISARTEPGVVVQSAGENKLFFGNAPDGKRHQKLIHLAEKLQQSGHKVSYAEDINSTLWHKFVFITPFAGCTAGFRSCIGDILSQEYGRRVFEKSLREAIAVSHAEGFLKDASSEDLVDQIMTTRVKDYKVNDVAYKATSSMYRDLVAGRRTEVDAINGSVIRLGQKHGIPTPVNECLYATIKLYKA